MLVSYGTNETEILSNLEEAKIVPSKNEGWRRGVQALDLLVESDERTLFELLSASLLASKQSTGDYQQLMHNLHQSHALANTIQAILTAKKGSPASAFMDAFTATLRDYSVLTDSAIYEKIDKSELAENLAGLRQIALRFAEDPLKRVLHIGENLQHEKEKTNASQATNSLPEITIERGDSLSALISKFFNSNWGNTPRTLTDVREVLQSYELNYPKQSVAVALLRLAKGSKIRRFKGEGGEYVYTSPNTSKQTWKAITSRIAEESPERTWNSQHEVTSNH